MSSEALAKEDTLRRGVAEEPTGTTIVKPWGFTESSRVAQPCGAAVGQIIHYESSSMTTQTEKDKMLAGELYRSADKELVADRRHVQTLLARYNAISDGDPNFLISLLREFMGAVGDGTTIMPLFTCDYGYNVRLGSNVFINYHCVFLDCAPIEIGHDVQIGPAVQLYTAQHPLDPVVRRSGLESAKPIRIGHDVWIGGGAVVLPGVTIGARSVVGAGTVVVRDVPPDTVVVGNPVRVVRTLP